MPSNIENFRLALANEYARLFETDPGYSYARSRNTPDGLAVKMTNSLLAGSADKNGKAIKAVCKQLRIKHTYKAIKAYLEGE